MYYGELCITSYEKDGKTGIKFYTRKRKSYVLQENEEVSVGDRIDISSEDAVTMQNVLLDIAALSKQGNMKKFRTEANGTLWTLHNNANFAVLTGPFLFDFVSEKSRFYIEVNAYLDESMEPTHVGKIYASNTGAVSIYQKCVTALSAFGITAAQVREYCRVVGESGIE